MSEPLYYDLDITVSGGVGSSVLNGTGWAAYTYVDVPDGAVWSLALADKDSKPITGRTNKTDDLVFVEQYPLKTKTTFSLTSTIDGVHHVRVWKYKNT